MPQRIVVSFRWVVPPGSDDTYLSRALSLKTQAEAHGATMCAWSALTFSFDFDPSDLEEAATLAAMAKEDAPAEPRFSAGVAEGEMQKVGEHGSLAMLGWGPPLVAAALLSRDARAGDVLLDRELADRRGSELWGLGFRVSLDRGRHVLSIRTVSQEPVPAAPSLPSLPPPPSPSARPPGSVPGVEPLAELAKQALLQGDMGAVDELLEKLRVTGEHGDLVERMTGLVALRRGATAEALRRLRDAAGAAKEPAQQTRARLAYGVALASAGRAEGALLEVLEALGLARAATDAPGERACTLFLARLSAGNGHPHAASVWARIAQGKS